jgi:hypothetical protein
MDRVRNHLVLSQLARDDSLPLDGVSVAQSVEVVLACGLVQLDHVEDWIVAHLK